MLVFTLILLVNIFLMAIIIRWRGFFSCEGIGMAFLALIVGSDALGLYFPQLFEAVFVIDVPAEMQLRYMPSIILTIGLISFMVGLFLSGRAASFQYVAVSQLAKKDRAELVATGYFLSAIGLGMNLYALYLAGFHSITDYYSNLYMYQAEKRGGEFLDGGINIAVLGLSLLLAVRYTDALRQWVLIICIITLAFTLSVSKSGINSAIIIMCFTLNLFNREILSRILRPVPIFASILILIIGLGVKTQIKYGSYDDLSFSSSDVIGASLLSLTARYGPTGIYRGYSLLTSQLIQTPDMYFNGEIIKAEIGAWIPRFIWPTKPYHPFNARGDLFNEDLRNDEYQNYAPTFAGYAFTDYGYLSLILYLMSGGLIVGYTRNWLASQQEYKSAFMTAYCFLSFQLGPSSAESGFLSLTYYLAFTAVLWLSIVVMLHFCENIFDRLVESPIATSENLSE